MSWIKTRKYLHFLQLKFLFNHFNFQIVAQAVNLISQRIITYVTEFKKFNIPFKTYSKLPVNISSCALKSVVDGDVYKW